MASRRDSAPTADDILSLYNLRETDGAEARIRDIATSMRQLTRMEHEVSIPQQYKAITKQVRTPYVRDTWLRATAALNVKPPVPHCEPVDITQDARKAANLAERWDAALLETVSRDTGEDAVYESSKALIRDGESVIKIVHKPDSWANFPKRDDYESADEAKTAQRNYKRRSGVPIAWRVVDRLSMIFGDGEYGDDWALEYGEYPKPYLKGRYDMVESEGRLVDPAYILGGRPAPKGELSSNTGLHTKIEYMDADWWAVVVDGSMAPKFPKKNPYAPHLIWKRAKAADSESLLYSLLYLVPRLDELLTMKLNWSYLGAYPNPVLEPVPSAVQAIEDLPTASASQPKKFTWSPGKLINTPLGYKFGFVPPPPIGADLDGLIGILSNLIDIAGIPSVFRGVGGSDQAGYAINQLMAAASMSFKVAGSSLERQMVMLLEMAHWIVANLCREPVEILGGAGEKSARQWLALKPEGETTATSAAVDKLGPLSFAFRPMLPTDEQARAMIALQLVNANKPLLSRRRAIEKYLQEEDPESILDEIAVDEALEEEPLKGMWLQRAVEEAHLLPAKQQQQGTGLVNQYGQPMSSGMAGIPGQASLGMPAVPGATMPLTPQVPRAPGMYPGQPNTPQAEV